MNKKKNKTAVKIKRKRERILMNKLQYINDTYVGIDPVAKTVRFRIENWRPYEPCSKLKIKKNICTYIKIDI